MKGFPPPNGGCLVTEPTASDVLRHEMRRHVGLRDNHRRARAASRSGDAQASATRMAEQPVPPDDGEDLHGLVHAVQDAYRRYSHPLRTWRAGSTSAEVVPIARPDQRRQMPAGEPLHDASSSRPASALPDLVLAAGLGFSCLGACPAHAAAPGPVGPARKVWLSLALPPRLLDLPTGARAARRFADHHHGEDYRPRPEGKLPDSRNRRSLVRTQYRPHRTWVFRSARAGQPARTRPRAEAR